MAGRLMSPSHRLALACAGHQFTGGAMLARRSHVSVVVRHGNSVSLRHDFYNFKVMLICITIEGERRSSPQDVGLTRQRFKRGSGATDRGGPADRKSTEVMRIDTAGPKRDPISRLDASLKRGILPDS